MAKDPTTAAPSAPDASGRIGLVALAAILVQLGLLTIAMRQFQIESAAFLQLWLLALAGFVVHALLPLRHRLPFFLALSIAGIVLVLGTANALWLIALGLMLIGICHLPIRYGWRVVLLLMAGGFLALQRAEVLPFPWSGAIWPILGAMFMFRMIIYAYDLRFEKSPPGFVRTTCYFFMLPNACFPLFPVIDFKTFRRNYFDADAFQIYQTGVDWILRGVIHLVLYRFVYYYLTLAPSEVHNAADLGQFLISNFLLYLRVSGLFHLVVGMLYLFGFRLPETHHHYVLASSFTDFWRRINIYWKDFMLKIFYYPAYFRLRKRNPVRALVLATLFVFVMTWFLHAYQWFWLRGTALFVWQDVLFWTILGGLVVANAIREERRGRQGGYGRQVPSGGALFRLTLQTFATFCAICVLWSFWTSESIGEWLGLWATLGGRIRLEAGHALIAVIALVIVVGVLRENSRKAGPNVAGGVARGAQRAVSPVRVALTTTAALVILVPVMTEQVYSRFPSNVATILLSLRSGHLSRLDNAKLERGYYENLLQVDRFNSQLWEVYMKRDAAANWLVGEGSAVMKRYTGDFAYDELKPSFQYSSTLGTMSTNRWGMRDRDYELVAPPGTFRIALLGPSTVMGWGVTDGATFEAEVERRLNASAGEGALKSYEILNFGVPGYQPPQEMVMLEKALRFAPNAVFYTATGREVTQANRYLIEAVNRRIANPYPELRALVEKAGLTPGMEESAALRRLEPYRAEALQIVYRYIVAQSRSHHAVPVWIFLPQVTEGAWQEETPEFVEIARNAGFVMIDLGDVYKRYNVADIRIAEWDDHPNALGHKVIAAQLFERLQQHREEIFGAASRQVVAR